ncbi:MAG: YihA family ribosome biogenesis GTP-binding protein [Myxococcaceae bacterium]|nr:YihA family ribosome biogenesis GTP-binding protein [Myxococcaceae bacterium]MCA3011539.1 YihA family ribosome biogenesis GTP-binding protein [Myxococcaceae bacterium]
MLKVLEASFVTTATKAAQWPREPVPEVAFVGRSNVGKSSMINALTNRKQLVRVSHTPGRTRTLNFFDATLEAKATKRTVRLCDLPGYGFAKVSKDERAQWQAMISEYLEGRRTLRVVVSIIDAEVGPTSDDVAMLDLLQAMPPRILVVATKLDRLGKAKRAPRLAALAAQLEVPPEALVGFSATERLGVHDVWSRLLVALDAG